MKLNQQPQIKHTVVVVLKESTMTEEDEALLASFQRIHESKRNMLSFSDRNHQQYKESKFSIYKK